MQHDYVVSPINSSTPFLEEPQLLKFRVRLREAMANADCDIDTLSQISGLSVSTLLRYLRAERVPSGLSLVRLAHTLNVSCDYLLGF